MHPSLVPPRAFVVGRNYVSPCDFVRFGPGDDLGCSVLRNLGEGPVIHRQKWVAYTGWVGGYSLGLGDGRQYLVRGVA